MILDSVLADDDSDLMATGDWSCPLSKCILGPDGPVGSVIVGAVLDEADRSWGACGFDGSLDSLISDLVLADDDSNL